MKFPDPNIGYVFGYGSRITEKGVMVTFLRGTVRILFRYSDIGQISVQTYTGRKVSWDVIRWGKCPTGTEALRITLKHGLLREHFIVFNDLPRAVAQLKEAGQI